MVILYFRFDSIFFVNMAKSYFILKKCYLGT